MADGSDESVRSWRGGTRRRARVLAAAALVALAGLLPRAAAAEGSVLIWPVDPHLGAADRAVAVWLENHGKQPLSLQIRVLAWHQQADGSDGYADQDGIQASPPLATIAPGKRQMVRLIQLAPAPADGELAYRVLVDEIPRADAPAPVSQGSAGIRFQMRYSVPLFVYGPGVWVHNPIDKDGPGVGARPSLSLHTGEADGRRFLYIANYGRVHARLAQASLVDTAGRTTPLAAGLLGYVLPGAQMRVALPPGVAAGALTLKTKVNDEVAPWSVASQ